MQKGDKCHMSPFCITHRSLVTFLHNSLHQMKDVPFGFCIITSKVLGISVRYFVRAQISSKHTQKCKNVKISKNVTCLLSALTPRYTETSPNRWWPGFVINQHGLNNLGRQQQHKNYQCQRLWNAERCVQKGLTFGCQIST